MRNRKTMIGTGIAATIAGAVFLLPTHQYGSFNESGNQLQFNKVEPSELAEKNTDKTSSNNQEALDDIVMASAKGSVANQPAANDPADSHHPGVQASARSRNKTIKQSPSTEQSAQQLATTADQKSENTIQLIAASTEDEMWRIAVENAEFYLMSNDGDPAPWIRTARKIAAGFRSDDGRLARTYFLAALLESDYRIAEQQYNRALSIQTKTLGLYHPETAQTLEALAWIAERNKESLEEAITHQRLALNIYRDIYGAEAEDTKAAMWKLEYFENRLAGSQPRIDENRRLLPALARFSN